MTIVKLKLRRTSEEGFLVILTASNRLYETEGFLPPLPLELESGFNEWQSAYRQIEDVRSYIAPAPGLRLTPKGVTINSDSQYTLVVKTYLNQWLNCGDSRWRPIRDGLIAIAQQLHLSHEEIRLILDAKDIKLRRLPWQEWNLFEEYYPQAEIALGVPKALEMQKTRIFPKSSKVRILVAVGRSDGINTKDDLHVVQRLEKVGAEVVCLMQPDLKDLCEALWDDKGYHIFVFTGHSGSREDGQIGWIEVNERESLSIEQFKDALKEAINRGLQLAIFNSCDGLGLANQLVQLHLPQSIVMREPIPDPVAVEFLKHFFHEFTRNQSLFTSVQKARKRLEHFKSRYPGAVWLPTISIEPYVEPLTWQGLCKGSRIPLKSRLRSPGIPKISLWIVLAALLGLGIGYTTTFLEFTFNHHRLEKSLLREHKRFNEVKVPVGTWLYGGSTTWAPIRKVVDQKIVRAFPKYKLTYEHHPILPPGSGTGIKMLLEGQISFSQSSRSLLDSEFKLATARGMPLKQIAVAIDAIAIAVHPNLKIKGLTIEQLKDIYTGKITNWSAVGGPNLKITPYSRPTHGSGTTEFFRENILGHKEKFGENIVFIHTTTQALQTIGKFPDEGGIYYATATELIHQSAIKTVPISRNTNSAFIAPEKSNFISKTKCHKQLNVEALQNGEYPLHRRLFVIIKQNDEFDKTAGEAYAKLLLTDEGQKLIKQAGFIPIRSIATVNDDDSSPALRCS